MSSDARDLANANLAVQVHRSGSPCLFGVGLRLRLDRDGNVVGISVYERILMPHRTADN